MNRRLLLPGSALCALVLGQALSACGDSSAPSPFGVEDAGTEAGMIDAMSEPDGDAGPDPTLGGPCTDDGQCDDQIECTSDRCDLTLSRCRHQPDSVVCGDGVFCDGDEVCEPGLGCREGEPMACSDGDSCTIDRCIESTQACEHVERDADGDGDPVWNCTGGDCDDRDPEVSSLSLERCDNQADDDCDGELDESDCVRPAHDDCLDALEVSSAGSYALSLAGAAHDYPLSCQEGDALRDVVVAVIVPEGEPLDVDVTATTPSASLVLGSSLQCGSVADETACVTSYESTSNSSVSRLRLRNLAPGAYPVYVAGDKEADVALTVRYEPPSSPPANETCGTAELLEAEQHRLLSLVGLSADLTTACAAEVGELVYRFELQAEQDVTLRAVSLHDFGSPVVSLRSSVCKGLAAELTCRQTSPSELFARALQPGEYYVAVSASAPIDLDLVLELDDPTASLPGEGCANPIALDDGATEQIDFEGRIDAVQSGCLVGAPDASFELAPDQKSDLLLMARLSEGDEAGLLLAGADCGDNDQLACKVAAETPLRLSAQGLVPQSYRVVVESAAGKPVALDAFLRPAAATTYVAFADECAAAVTIPAGGGRFSGSTVSQFGDYDAGCDFGGADPGGAPDQMLLLELDSKRRVIFDMQGSEYETMLSVRKGPACPGSEVSLGCSVGETASRSFLDLTLDAGTYYVQVDGYDGASGRWLLDVFITAP